MTEESDELTVRVIDDEAERRKMFMESEAWKEHQRQCDKAKAILEKEEGLSQEVEQAFQEEIEKGIDEPGQVKYEQGLDKDFDMKYDKQEVGFGCACGMKFKKDAVGNIMQDTDTESKKDSNYKTGGASSDSGYAKSSDAPKDFYKD